MKKLFVLFIFLYLVVYFAIDTNGYTYMNGDVDGGFTTIVWVSIVGAFVIILLWDDIMKSKQQLL